MPNGLNRALHESLSVIAIPWSNISEFRQRFGMATQIADALTASGTFTFRCYGMKSLLSVAQAAKSRG